MSDREFIESPWEQGNEEAQPYVVTITPWKVDPGAAAPSSVTTTLWDWSNPASPVDAAALLSGSNGVDGDEITTKVVGPSLVSGKRYRLEVKFTVEGRVLECYGYIDARP